MTVLHRGITDLKDVLLQRAVANNMKHPRLTYTEWVLGDKLPGFKN